MNSLKEKLKKIAEEINTDDFNIAFTELKLRAEYLIDAIRQNDIQAVQKAIDRHADITHQVREELHKTPLHFAIEVENEEIARLLLDEGMNPNLWDREGNTPLIMAVQRNNLQLAELLFQYNATANVNCITTHTTALHEAVKNDNLEMVNFLLEKGADVADENCAYETPIFEAVRKKNLPIFLALYEHGAKIERNDFSFGFKLERKENYTDIEVIAHIIRYGSNWYEQYKLDQLIKQNGNIEINTL